MPQYQRRQQNMNKRNRRNSRIYRIYQRHINNQDTLNRITNLPRQFSVNPLIDEFFNGTPSY